MSSPFSTGGVRSRIEGVALLAVLALLGVLAVMQHQWLGALAEGERRKLTEDANEKVSLIARDIDRELTKTYLELRLDSKTVHAGTSLPARVEAPAFAEQLEKWRADSPHAGLVKDIFMAERKPDGPVRLLKFDRDVGAFVEESWPEVLQPVRRAIETGPEQALGMALPMSLPIATLPPPIMADVPALTAPVLSLIHI